MGLIYYLGVFRTLEGYTKKGYNRKKEVVARFFKTEKLAMEFRLHFFFVRLFITKDPMQ